jgi:hypothetical protein
LRANLSALLALRPFTPLAIGVCLQLHADLAGKMQLPTSTKFGLPK